MTCPDTNVWPFMYDREVIVLVEGGVRVRRVDADELDPPAIYVRCGIEPLLRASGLWWEHVLPTDGSAISRLHRFSAPFALTRLAATVLREGRDDGLPQHLDYLASSVDWKKYETIGDWQHDAHQSVREVLRGYRDGWHTVRLLNQLDTHCQNKSNFIANRYRCVDGGLPWTQR